MTTTDHNMDPEEILAIMPFKTVLFLLAAVAFGAFAAIAVLPDWLPELSASLTGEAPKVFWFLSRSSAGLAFCFLWVSMLLGLLITNKLAKVWPGGPLAVDLHQFFSLFGLGFALFHALILMGDEYIQFSLVDVLVPFSGQAYRPFWVSMGQIGFYLIALVTFSFYVRRQITTRIWRLLHWLSYMAYGLALLHGIFSGTDSANPWVSRFYLASGTMLLFFFVYRLLMVRRKPKLSQRVSAG